jgi:ribosome biogenesis protein Nip4
MEEKTFYSPADAEKAIMAFIGELGTESKERIFKERIKNALESEESGILMIGKNIFRTNPSCCGPEMGSDAKSLVYCGIKMGAVAKGRFLPAPGFLNALLESKEEMNYVVLNSRAEWLFLCGRDVFNDGIAKKHIKSKCKCLVLNENGECLGYGLVEKNGAVEVKNLFDLGDFLRRERIQE